MILSVDPGKHAYGFALWDDDELSCAWMGPLSSIHDRVPFRLIDHLVLEVPRVYKRSPVPPNDIVDLAYAAGRLQGEVENSSPRIQTKIYYPRDWKGTVKKDVMCRRIERKLSPEERARVELPTAESLHHNVWDGVGIGLKFQGRL